MIPLSILDLASIVQGGTASDGARQHPRPRPPRRTAGLPPLLAGRASQHDRHRQRRDVGGDRARRGGHLHHPRRRGRGHAAQPRAATHRRAVRHARRAASRGGSISGSAARRHPIRPTLARAATRSVGGGLLSAGRPRAACTVRASDCRARRCRRCPVPDSTCRSGSSARASSARSSRRRSGCPSPLRRTSRRDCCTRRSRSIAAASRRRTGPVRSSSRTSCSA